MAAAFITLGAFLLPMTESFAQADFYMDCSAEGKERPGLQKYSYLISPGRGEIIRGNKVSYVLKTTPEGYLGERTLPDTTKVIITIDKTSGAFKRTIYRSDGNVFDAKEGTCIPGTKP